MAENEKVVETENVETTPAEVENTTENNGDAEKELQKLRQELEKNKKRLSEVNSEAANYKRALREKQSADEQAEADRAEAQAKMEQELAELRKEKTVSDYTSRFIGIGYAEEDATKAAKAYADGDVDTVFSSFKSFADNLKKSVVADAMNKQGGLSVGREPSTEDVAKQNLNATRKAMGLPPI